MCCITNEGLMVWQGEIKCFSYTCLWLWPFRSPKTVSSFKIHQPCSFNYACVTYVQELNRACRSPFQRDSRKHHNEGRFSRATLWISMWIYTLLFIGWSSFVWALRTKAPHSFDSSRGLNGTSRTILSRRLTAEVMKSGESWRELTGLQVEPNVVTVI